MRTEAAPQKNWRYVALDLEPSADPETIERTYRRLRDTYAARAENYSDFDSRRSLQLLEEAYESLRREASGPQTYGRSAAVSRSGGGALGNGLVIGIVALATIFAVVALTGVRPQALEIIGALASQAQALMHDMAVAV